MATIRRWLQEHQYIGVTIGVLPPSASRTERRNRMAFRLTGALATAAADALAALPDWGYDHLSEYGYRQATRLRTTLRSAKKEQKQIIWAYWLATSSPWALLNLQPPR